MTIVFMKLKYVLLKEILKDNDFAGLNLAVIFNGKEVIYKIILYLYKSNF